MKLKQWLYGATALAMLAACSDKDIAPGGDPNDANVTFTAKTSYLGITLELPTDPSTRADNQANDRFDDGTRDEYNVDSAALLLFVGADEDNAKFLGAYTLTPSEAYDQPSHDQITVSFQQAVRLLEQPNTSAQLWGLALVNYREDHFDITTDTSDSGPYGNLTIITEDEEGNETRHELARIKNERTDNDGVIINPATKFSDIRKYITNCKFMNITGSGNGETLNSIFMTNAPLSTEAGTGSAPSTNLKIQTLAKLEKSKFKDTEQAAILDPAGCIFVERAVAKVTCTSFPAYAELKRTPMENATTGAIKPGTTQTTKIKIENVEWMIDNEEIQSYIIRNALTNNDFWSYNNNNLYRFIGEKSLENTGVDASSTGTFDGNTNGHKFYRTYWCVDPSYTLNETSGKYDDGDKEFKDQANGTYTSKYKKNTLAQKNWSDDEDADNSNAYWMSNTPLYCHENTFDVKHQNYQNTTRVIFKVQYDPSTPMFAIRDELDTYYLESDAKNLLLRHVLASPTLNSLVKSLMTPGNNTLEYTTNDIDATFDVADADEKDSTGKEICKKGDYIITELKFSSSFYNRNIIPSETNLTAEQKNEIKTTLAQVAEDANKKNNIVKFNDNTCYYAVYIKHFGDTYCSLPANWKGDDVTTVYQNDANKYEGRYGMVRNNWYDLVINSISNLGKATVPNGNTTTSDDNKTDKWYISARVHVLSWARRTQSTDL